MMKMTHTPEPWSYEYARDGHHYVFAADGPVAVVSVQIDPDQQEANARLITAAPNLLAMLKEAEEVFEEIVGSCDEDCECILHRMRAGIAEAEVLPV
jgi:hypothetical protein